MDKLILPSILLTLSLTMILGTASTSDINDELAGLAECIRFLEIQEPQGEEIVLPVNVIDGQEVNGSLAYQLATELQCGMEVRSSCSPLPVSSFSSPSDSNLWFLLRRRRMLWRGAINVLILPEDAEGASKVIKEYLGMVWERFFTGEGLGLADARRQDLMYRNLYHVFYFTGGNTTFQATKDMLEDHLEESIQAMALFFAREYMVMEVFWSKATPDGSNSLKLVNNYVARSSLFQVRSSLLPRVDEVYHNMFGRHFQHPAMHKPPWNFVTYQGPNKDYVEDNGGRDITIMSIMAKALNFTFENVDPRAYGIKRSRGSAWGANYTFPRILGKVHRREDPFFMYLGDTTQTYTRNSAVEFSFFVLADSGAFVTQAPDNFIPPDIVIRPFSVYVWMWIGISAIVIVVVMVIVIFHARNMYDYFRHRLPPQAVISVFRDDHTFLQIVGKVFDSLLRCALVEDERYFIHHQSYFLGPTTTLLCFWMVLFTGVLVPSYQGSLLSFYSIPFTRTPINTLEQLKTEMKSFNMSLGVTDGSSSFGIISTGGGIYSELWTMMQKKNDWLIPSVKAGLLKTMEDPTFAVFAGREKLVYDTILLGEDTFNINSQVFFTKYKGVVLRNGSPMRNNIDSVLLILYDSGITNKITQDEYHGITRRNGAHGRKFDEARLDAARKSVESRRGKGSRKPLALNQLMSSVYFYCFIVLLTVACFFIEVLVGWYCKMRLKERLERAAMLQANHRLYFPPEVLKVKHNKESRKESLKAWCKNVVRRRISSHRTSLASIGFQVSPPPSGNHKNSLIDDGTVELPNIVQSSPVPITIKSYSDPNLVSEVESIDSPATVTTMSIESEILVDCDIEDNQRQSQFTSKPPRLDIV